jgi:hypothetical protein
MGTNLNRTVASYNEMVGNLEGRVMISGRRLRDRAISLKRGDEIPEAEPIETTARPLSAPEFLTLESGEGSETRVLTGGLGSSNGSHHGTNGSTNGAGKNGSNGTSNGHARSNGHTRTNGPANLAVSALLNVLGLLRK